MTTRFQSILGWCTVGLSTLAASFWGFWGILENFHEGWYGRSIWINLGLMLVQYLAISVLLVGMAMIAIRMPRLGAAIHAAAAVWLLWFFRKAAPGLLYPFIAGPLILLAIGYWYGRPEPRRWAIAIALGLPLLVILACGVVPAYRIATRVDDGDHSARHIQGNGINLIWAPEGPGWPSEGVSWDEANRRCRYLTVDGLSLSDVPQNRWRLPTVDEAVRSAQRHGANSGGIWDPGNRRATYVQWPDKESPLWDIYSPVIYWWTADEANEKQAYIIVYNGQVWPRSKSARWGYLAFRAVKVPDDR